MENSRERLGTPESTRERKGMAVEKTSPRTVVVVPTYNERTNLPIRSLGTDAQ